MTPVHCTTAGTGEFGDCWRACIASILDLTAADVPNFMAIAGQRASNDVEWNKIAYELAREWLSERGLGIFRVWVTGEWSLEKLLDEYGAFSPEVPYIVHGTPAGAQQGAEAHAVVAVGGRIAHDPSDVGIERPCLCLCKPDCAGIWWLDIISFAVPA